MKAKSFALINKSCWRHLRAHSELPDYTNEETVYDNSTLAFSIINYNAARKTRFGGTATELKRRPQPRCLKGRCGRK